MTVAASARETTVLERRRSFVPAGRIGRPNWTKETGMSRSSTSLVLVVVALLTAPLAGAANGAPTASGPSKQAIRALTLRGQALNQTYHLGGPSKQAIRALTLRGQALNQTYHLGEYAGRTGSSFLWLTAAFAAAATIGVILAAFAGTVGVRRRRAVIAV
jgi:hypothetical protein